MKYLNVCIVLFALTCSAFFMTSCEKTEVKGSITFTGKIEVSPSVAKVGDEVTFSIDNSFSIGGVMVNYENSTVINGKEVVKSVVYYIDDTEITESTDSKNDYVATYKVSGLAVGIHSVTAHCKSNFKDVEIKESIAVGTLTIEE